MRKIYEVKDNQVVIKLPEDFKGKKRVLITVDTVDETLATKLELMKEAANDPLFQADVEEMATDFENIEGDGI